MNNARVAFSDQSSGFRWFFSFIMRYISESRGALSNCVILLDEPGLHLHPTGQRTFLEQIKQHTDQSKILYTTHLPFLVDMSDPLSVKTVVSAGESAKDHTVRGSCVKSEIWNTGEEAKAVVEAALGVDVAKFLSLRRNNIIVEGVCEFILLNELSRLAGRLGRDPLNEEVALVPAGSANKISHMATYMAAHNLKIVCLYDNDNQGRQASERQQKLIQKYTGKETSDNIRIMKLSDAIETEKTHFELEDIFDRSYYLKMAAATRNGHANLENSFQEYEAYKSNAEAGASLLGSKFSKKDVIIKIARDMRSVQNAVAYEKYIPNLCGDVIKLIEHINALFKDMDENAPDLN